MKCADCGGTGQRAGAREAFVPRPGYVFAQADFPQLELYTLAQCCVTWVGWSKLADALNSGLDPHLQVASLILKITYEEAAKTKKTDAVKDARGAGKVANFGFPGGLGIDSLVDYAKKSYGVTLTRTQAKELKDYWLAAWPEMQAYFARVNALCDNDSNRATVETLFTKRTRGNATYCAACNNGFQALGADCAKNAGWLIAKAAYVDIASPLFNARPVAFVHDEFIAEVVDGPRAHDAAFELARLMVKGANVYLPDVPIPMSKMEPTLMRRWSKNAVQCWDEKGRLIPWE
jgi:DNA polymerase I